MWDEEDVALIDSHGERDVESLDPIESPNETDGRHLGLTSAVFLILNRMIGTGVFSIPSSIYQLTGSVGWSLVLWICGGLIACCGFSVYLEYGLQMPFSGGEKNYLDRVYTNPPKLALTIFTVVTALLSFSTSNSFAFGNYLQMGLGLEPEISATRWIGCITVGLVCLLHSRFPHAGRTAFNVLGFAKVFILALIASTGPLLALGIIKIDGGNVAHHNFGEMWKNDGFGGGLYDIGVALMRISYSYRGWETCNMVLGELEDPERTIKRAGIIALATITALYTLCNYAYFAAIYKEDVANSGVLIAGVFLLKLFGESTASHVLPLIICVSNLGNILVVTYALSRVVQELGKHDILPFSKFLASDKPWKTPAAALFMHFVMTVLTLTLPPPGDIYNFVVDLSTYPVAIFATMITIGLILVHRNPDKYSWNPEKSYRAPLIGMIVFLISNFMMLVFPWIPPQIPKTGLPYYASPLASVLLIFVGLGYWCIRHNDYLHGHT